jgi:hypothetical protein
METFVLPGKGGGGKRRPDPRIPESEILSISSPSEADQKKALSGDAIGALISYT